MDLIEEEDPSIQLCSTSQNQSTTNVIVNGSIKPTDLPLVLLQSNKAKRSNSPSPISSSSQTITSNTTVSHSIDQEDRRERNINRPPPPPPEEEEASQQTIHISSEAMTNGKKEQYQQFTSDDESDNDYELLNTLAQLHGLIPSARPSQDNESNNVTTDHLLLSSDNIEKKNRSFSNEIDKQMNKSSPTPFSLTSSTSSMQFSDEEFTETLPSEILSEPLPRKLSDHNGNTSLLSCHDDNENDLKQYLQWIINHFNEDSQPIESSNSSILSEDNDQSESISLSSSTTEIVLMPMIERFLSITIQQALKDVEDYHDDVEQLVRQILTEAVYQIYEENVHGLDPNEEFTLFSLSNVNVIDSWSNPNGHNQKRTNPNESFPSSALLIDISDSALTAHESMKYRLTSAVKSNSSDNSSIFPDAILIKVIDFSPFSIGSSFFSSLLFARLCPPLRPSENKIEFSL